MHNVVKWPNILYKSCGVHLYLLVYLDEHFIQIFLLGKVTEMLILHKRHHATMILLFFLALVIITFSLPIIFGISETRVISFDAVLCIFKGSSVNVNSDSFSKIFQAQFQNFLLQVPFQKALTFRCLTDLLK